MSQSLLEGYIETVESISAGIERQQTELVESVASSIETGCIDDNNSTNTSAIEMAPVEDEVEGTAGRPENTEQIEMPSVPLNSDIVPPTNGHNSDPRERNVTQKRKPRTRDEKTRQNIDSSNSEQEESDVDVMLIEAVLEDFKLISDHISVHTNRLHKKLISRRDNPQQMRAMKTKVLKFIRCTLANVTSLEKKALGVNESLSHDITDTIPNHIPVVDNEGMNCRSSVDGNILLNSVMEQETLPLVQEWDATVESCKNSAADQVFATMVINDRVTSEEILPSLVDHDTDDDQVNLSQQSGSNISPVKEPAVDIRIVASETKVISEKMNSSCSLFGNSDNDEDETPASRGSTSAPVDGIGGEKIVNSTKADSSEKDRNKESVTSNIPEEDENNTNTEDEFVHHKLQSSTPKHKVTENELARLVLLNSSSEDADSENDSDQSKTSTPQKKKKTSKKKRSPTENSRKSCVVVSSLERRSKKSERSENQKRSKKHCKAVSSDSSSECEQKGAKKTKDGSDSSETQDKETSKVCSTSKSAKVRKDLHEKFSKCDSEREKEDKVNEMKGKCDSVSSDSHSNTKLKVLKKGKILENSRTGDRSNSSEKKAKSVDNTSNESDVETVENKKGAAKQKINDCSETAEETESRKKKNKAANRDKNSDSGEKTEEILNTNKKKSKIKANVSSNSSERKIEKETSSKNDKHKQVKKDGDKNSSEDTEDTTIEMEKKKETNASMDSSEAEKEAALKNTRNKEVKIYANDDSSEDIEESIPQTKKKETKRKKHPSGDSSKDDREAPSKNKKNEEVKKHSDNESSEDTEEVITKEKERNEKANDSSKAKKNAEAKTTTNEAAKGHKNGTKPRKSNKVNTSDSETERENEYQNVSSDNYGTEKEAESKIEKNKEGKKHVNDDLSVDAEEVKNEKTKNEMEYVNDVSSEETGQPTLKIKEKEMKENMYNSSSDFEQDEVNKKSKNVSKQSKSKNGTSSDDFETEEEKDNEDVSNLSTEKASKEKSNKSSREEKPNQRITRKHSDVTVVILSSDSEVEKRRRSSRKTKAEREIRHSPRKTAKKQSKKEDSSSDEENEKRKPRKQMLKPIVVNSDFSSDPQCRKQKKIVKASKYDSGRPKPKSKRQNRKESIETRDDPDKEQNPSKMACRVVLDHLPVKWIKQLEETGVVILKQVKKKYSDDEEDKEVRRLCSFNDLKRKRRKTHNSSDSSTSVSKQKKRSKKSTKKVNCSFDASNNLFPSSDESDSGKEDKSKDASTDINTDVLVSPEITAMNENELAKVQLLMSSDDSELFVMEDESDKECSKKKTTKTKSGKVEVKKVKKLKLFSSDEDEENGDEKETKKKDKKKSDESSESEKENKKTKKQDKLLRARVNFKSDVETDSDDSDIAVTAVKIEPKKNKRLVLSSDDDFQDPQPKRSTKRIWKSDSSSNQTLPSASESDSSSKRKTQKKKRRRIQAPASSSDSDCQVLEPNQKSDDTLQKRKKIRKIMKSKNLESDTKSAARTEEERRQRIAERQKLYNESFALARATNVSQSPESGIPKKIVLDFDEDTREVLLDVDKSVVKNMKPHQVQGVKFMWDSVFESLIRAKDSPGSGCILAHCMGLGKTLQVIALIHTVLTRNVGTKTALVVAPLNTVLNWDQEFNKWLSKCEDDISIYELTKYKQDSIRCEIMKAWKRRGGVLIIGYNMFRTLTNVKAKRKKFHKETYRECLVDPGPDLVVCDEGHLLKNEATAVSKAMMEIKTFRRIVLTGTPLQNNLSEYHCMVQFVKPNLLGTKREFHNRFVHPITNGQHADSTLDDVRLMKRRAHVLHRLLAGCVQRLDYNVLRPFLPPKFEYVISISLSPIQIKLYKYYLDNYAQGGPGRGGGRGLFSDFQMFGRIWTHPLALDLALEKREKTNRENSGSESEGSIKEFIDDGTGDSDDSTDPEFQVVKNTNSEPQEDPTSSTKTPRDWWRPLLEDDDISRMELSGKIVLLFEVLKECEEIGDKVLVFSQSLVSLDLIEDSLKRVEDFTQASSATFSATWVLGRDYFRLDGSSSPADRKTWCTAFNRKLNNRGRLFLISTKAGSLGINLCAANRVILFDVSWNPSQDVQSIFRVYRFGQEKPCYIYRFIAQSTMEERIYSRQVTKESLACRVVDEQQIERHFNSADLAELYRFTPEEDSAVRPIPAVPKDKLLAELLTKHKDLIFTYHEHDSLLQNVEEEELNEDERKAAWADYENERQGRNLSNVNAWNIETILAIEDPLQQSLAAKRVLDMLSNSMTNSHFFTDLKQQKPAITNLELLQSYDQAVTRLRQAQLAQVQKNQNELRLRQLHQLNSQKQALQMQMIQRLTQRQQAQPTDATAQFLQRLKAVNTLSVRTIAADPLAIDPLAATMSNLLPMTNTGMTFGAGSSWHQPTRDPL